MRSAGGWNPAIAGPSYVPGTLATHPLYLSEVICRDLKISRLMCSRQSFVEGHAPLEANAVTLWEDHGGAIGQVWVLAVNAGAMHSQKVRIVGKQASIEWWDEPPKQLRHEVQGEPARVRDRGMPYQSSEALAEDRIGTGHPEGLFEAWANLYTRFAIAMEAHDERDPRRRAGNWYPDVAAEVEAVRWVAACVQSPDRGGAWIDYA